MKWSEEEINFLRDNYQSMSYREMSENIGRTENSIKNKVSRLAFPTKKVKDLKNKTFGRLFVIEKTTRRINGRIIWKCLCKCGNETEVISSNLIKGHTKSCGCLAVERSSKALIKNLKGKRFGKLRIIKLSDEKKNARRIWVCECDCGNICERVSTDLISGNTKSCGCYHTEIMTGSKNWRYNPLLTDEERLKNRYQLGGLNLLNWRVSVFKRDTYTCQLCGIIGGELHAHHMDSWDTYHDKRFDINNGVTLCVGCHTSFHKEYGYGKNTKEQFVKFKVVERG